MPLPYRNDLAVLATLHRKEEVLRPILAEGLGLRVEVVPNVDTDAFGTFTGEIARRGSQLDAAQAKIAAAFHARPEARIAVASEGSFGPHPHLPFVSLGREIVVLVDRDRDLTLIGHHADLQTNYANKILSSLEEAETFAAAAGFPRHGLSVIGVTEGRPDPTRFLDKDVTDPSRLRAAVASGISACGVVLLQTDMRAHRNPTRMAAIRRAAENLVQVYRSSCPRCSRPGFGIRERVPGLPCSACGEPTPLVLKEIWSCSGCGEAEERRAKRAAADPAECPACNP